MRLTPKGFRRFKSSRLRELYRNKRTLGANFIRKNSSNQKAKLVQSKDLIVKCSGGATAQLLALVNAIYISQKFNRSFKLKYFPYSTGTYWKFEINELITAQELLTESEIARNYPLEVRNGEYIKILSTNEGKSNHEKIIHILKFFKIDLILKLFRKEIVIGGKRKNLDKVSAKTVTISGNFVPLIDLEVFKELSSRFENSRLINPFKILDTKFPIVIHYRLGDMRKMPSRMPGYGGHGVVDPSTFKYALLQEGIEIEKYKIHLVSDEPLIAKKLLQSVGIFTEVSSSTPKIWSDLQMIANADLFIGSLSQFSYVGAMLSISNGGRAILPTTVYGEENLNNAFKIPQIQYCEYRYLEESHWIFHQNS